MSTFIINTLKNVNLESTKTHFSKRLKTSIRSIWSSNRTITKLWNNLIKQIVSFTIWTNKHNTTFFRVECFSVTIYYLIFYIDESFIKFLWSGFLNIINVNTEIVEFTANPLVHFFQTVSKKNSLYIIQMKALDSLCKNNNNLPFLLKIKAIYGRVFALAKCYTKSMSTFLSKEVLDYFLISIQFNLLKDINNILFSSTNDVTDIINKILNNVHNSLNEMFASIIQQNNSMKKESANMFKYNSFFYQAFSIPCIDPMEFSKTFHFCFK
ncbi:hypothetical protein EIN_000340 [Entamoeba invadens IP1]|uniref:Uncharacterized protein n=1 Tax=Entamoeba invadens IP1 TaxID=370355 RepID=L7FJ90_ENTIV|nr:hypothetical protein EIN_000340 [Entamoeba invadens IP1]ELP83601.1 hypothetical protein EIN_000340 [Entamoeba invadens IP1]|eukprot:XP_004182947.1 hypothetical protein EIN_000340 [Entamoeba invadens IP1]